MTLVIVLEGLVYVILTFFGFSCSLIFLLLVNGDGLSCTLEVIGLVIFIFFSKGLPVIFTSEFLYFFGIFE